MPAFAIIDIDVTDAARYESYKRLSEVAAAKHGGRFVVRGGAPESLEGVWAPRRIVVLEFADKTAARAWYDSVEYREARAVRKGAAEFRAILVDGVS